MARAVNLDLGTVVKVHASGMVETDKGFRSNIKAEKGDKLVQNRNTRKVAIKTSKTKDDDEPTNQTQLDLGSDE